MRVCITPHTLCTLQAELMFEVFNVPAMYLARAPTLGALSIGRASAIVVDLGHDATQVTPVYDGYVINSACPAQCDAGADSPCFRVFTTIPVHAP